MIAPGLAGGKLKVFEASLYQRSLTLTRGGRLIFELLHLQRFESLLLAALPALPPGVALERAGKRGKLRPKNSKYAVRHIRGDHP